MTPELLIARVAHHHGVTIADVRGRSRMRHIAYARQVAAWALRTALPKLSLVEIGRMLGGLNHTTVIYSVRQIAQACAADARLAGELYALIELREPRRSRPADDPIWYGCKIARTA